MKFRYLLVTVLFLAIAGICFLLGRNSAEVVQSPAVKARTLSEAAPRPKAAEQSNRGSPSSTLFPEVVRKPSALYITHKGPSYSVAMQFLVNRLEGVSLTADQLQKLQDVYTALSEARLNYEVSIAKVGVISDRESLIEIPGYEAFGQQLKQATSSMFEDVLGAKLAAEVLNQLDITLESWNGYWGKYPKSILVGYDPATKLYRITQTVYLSPTGRDVTDGASDVAHLDTYTKFLPLFPKPHQK